MDQSLLQLIALIVGFAGALSAIAEYSVPEFRQTFWNGNPFQAKHAAIQRFSVPFFLAFAAVGVLVQAALIILGDSIPSRLHAPADYVVAAALIAVLTYSIVRAGHWLTHRLALRHWLPTVHATQANLVNRAWYACQNDWLFEEQVAEIQLIDPNALPGTKTRNRDSIDRNMHTVARLLDLSSRGSLPARIARLRNYLDNHPLAERPG